MNLPVVHCYLLLTGEYNELSLLGRCWFPRWNSVGAAVQSELKGLASTDLLKIPRQCKVSTLFWMLC